MQGITMLVSGDGEWLLPDTPEFLAVLGDPNPDYDAVGFAVKNLGFIKMELFGQSVAEIELHPRNVELPALLAVQQQLLTSNIRLFRIKYFQGGGWKSEISSSPRQTIERLSVLCAPEPVLVRSDLFSAQPKEFSTLFEEGNIFRTIAQKWRVSFGNFDPTIISVALRTDLLPRLAVIGVRPPHGDPVFRFIGEGHKWVGQDYHVAGIGQKMSDLPDKEYGAWISEYFRSVALSGEPRYDLVTAPLRYENENGKPRRTVNYDRLLLPWKTPSDEIFVTSCTAIVGRGREADSADNSFVKKAANSA